MIGAAEGTAVDKSIECNFDEIYITDFTDEYVLALDLDCDIDDPHDSIVVQEPINSRTPVITKTALTNYDSGFLEALPLSLDANGNFTTVGARKYKEDYIDFLKRSNKKFLKTNKGDAWLIYVTKSPKIIKKDVEEADTVRFSWTEIGDAPLVDES
jgi:hypothetical protein